MGAGVSARCTRCCSCDHTGVSLPGRSGRVPRSVWLSPGEWKSLPREASRPNSSAMSAYFWYSAALWLPVTTSTPRPPWALNSVNSAYSSVGVKR